MCFEFEHSPDADQIDAVCDQFRDATKSDDADLIAEIDSVVADTNKKVSNPEQIKKYTILEVDFTQETDEFTLTLKLKRNTTLEQNPNCKNMHSDKPAQSASSPTTNPAPNAAPLAGPIW
ncbi:hypothetical protein GCM10020255_004280 [Rhodococcus baikonurensis]